MKLTALTIAVCLLAACSSGSVDDSGELPPIVADWEMVGGTIDGAAFPLVDGFRITMNLADDGTIGGTAACNGYGGSYVADGEDLIVSEISYTEMGCQPEVMESEQAFLSVLQQPMTYERDGADLILRTDQAQLQLQEILPVDPAELIGTDWVLDSLISDEAVSSVRGEPRLRFDEDGTMVGSTGCRDLLGTFVVDGDELRFTSLAAQGECPEDLADQDRHILGVLEAPRIEIEGRRLTLTTAGDDGISLTAPSD